MTKREPAWAMIGRSAPLVRRSANLVFVVCLLMGLVEVLWPKSPLVLLRADTLSILTGVAAAGCCLLAAATWDGRGRRAWLLFGAMMLLTVCGDVLWALYAEGDGMQPILGVADWLYVAALPTAMVAMVVMPVARGWRDAWAPLVFDAGMLAPRHCWSSPSSASTRSFASRVTRGRPRSS